MDGLNNITLNSVLLTELYQRSLVETGSAAPDKQPNTGIKYLGNNESGVLVLVHNPAHTFLAEDELAFLSKILGACKLNIGDVAIINTVHYTDIQLIADTLSPAYIIAFEPATYPGTTPCVQSSPLSNLTAETPEARELKSALWNNLKAMFNL